MTEKFQEIRDSDGNTVARVVDNPQQIPNRLPWWLEIADGYEVVEGKQACHDRRGVERVKVKKI